MSWHNVWRPIPSVPGYEASRGGEIRRGNRVLAQHKHDTPRAVYMRAQVWIDGQRVWRRVNRLVCEAFNGPGEDGQHAMHRNGDALDNRAANLSWGDPSANYVDQVRHGTAHIRPLPRNKQAWCREWARRRGCSMDAARRALNRRIGKNLAILKTDFHDLRKRQGKRTC